MRLIDADAFLERVLPECKYPDILKEAVENQPTIEPEVRHGRHGRWITLPESCQADYECSECGAGIGTVKPPYCAYCGAKMDGGE